MAPAAQFGFILENIGGGEIVVIAFLALVVLGPERIPEMARSAGRMIHNLRKLTSELTGDMQEIVNDPAMQPIRELGEFAVRPRQKLAEYALEAEAEERSKATSATADAPSGAEDASPVPDDDAAGSTPEPTPAGGTEDDGDTATGAAVATGTPPADPGAGATVEPVGTADTTPATPVLDEER